MRTASLEEIKTLVGQELGVSDWVVMDQPRINMFADATEDHNSVHIDPKVGIEWGLGGTIAHGFLTLSMILHLQEGLLPMPANLTRGYNYGLEHVRFTSPVRCDRRVRGRFKLDSLTERKPGEWLYVVDVVIEIENEAKPAVTAKWLSICYV